MPAKYDNLPVFKLCYEALFMVIGWSSKMQKDFRYGIADDLRKIVMAILLDIYRANSSLDKIPHIEKSLERLVEVKVYTRVLYDARQISLKQYALASEKFVNIEKHLSNWLNYNKNKKDA